MPRSPKPDIEKCIKVSLSIEPKQYMRIIEYCEKNDRSLAWVVRQAVDKWLKEHKDDSID